ncbi:Lrp/AsnC family transcriptional regulator [Halocatena halophila]|uniref:Lrp/AsnC family transcriptional regulator n=1 Tax=Halocatena halophila TaxID=2814576 RepID=UPI002ED163EC
MTTEFDSIDRTVVNALQGNGRATILDIADRTNIPATTIQKRLQRLDEEGVIDGYESIVDYGQLGFELTVVFKLVVDQVTESITQALEADRYIISCYEVTGEFDLLAIGRFPDSITMSERVQSMLSDPAIRAGSTDIVHETILENEPVTLKKIEH